MSDVLDLQQLRSIAEYSFQKKVFITGEAGSGKSSLVKRLSVQYLQAGDYNWVFRIESANLTSHRYPERQDPYRWSDLIVRECLEPNCENADRAKIHAWLFQLNGDSLAVNIFNSFDKVLVIIDGLDELRLPTHLESAFQDLMYAANLVVTSRPYDLDKVNKFFISSQRKHIAIEGFSNEVIRNYISIYLHASQPLDSSDCIADQTSYLTSYLAPFLAEAQGLGGEIGKLFSIPMILNFACMAVLSGAVNLQSSAIKAIDLWEAVVLLLLMRYVEKFNFMPIEMLDKLTAFAHCKVELCFTEYFAFQVMEEGPCELAFASFYLSEDLKVKNKIIPLEQRNFGFISLASDGTIYAPNQGLMKHHFSHVIFQYYFCARYLISCLA